MDVTGLVVVIVVLTNAMTVVAVVMDEAMMRVQVSAKPKKERMKLREGSTKSIAVFAKSKKN